DSLARKAIQNTKLNLANALFHHDSRRCAELLRNVLRSLQRAHVGRRKDHVEDDSVAQESSGLDGLLGTQRRKWSVYVPQAAAPDSCGSRGLGAFFGQVALGLSMANDDQQVRPLLGLFHRRSIYHAGT